MSTHNEDASISGIAPVAAGSVTVLRPSFPKTAFGGGGEGGEPAAVPAETDYDIEDLLGRKRKKMIKHEETMAITEGLDAELQLDALTERSDDNAYFRRVKNGNGDDMLRRFQLRLKAAKTREEVEILIGDLDDAIEDCGYTTDKHRGERYSDAMHAGVGVGYLAGHLATDDERNRSGNAATGALVGMGVGLALAHFATDSTKNTVERHVAGLRQVRNEAKDKLLTMR